ncbi:MAG: STAS domain-containing protein [Deltaproteobacteria bacterium]|nr:STAS domain-containing protein [Deltaproteobacteria bacterium]MBN2674473.1 STAS domain-containing protein [Deltaproteobacteria bacterium]
MTNIQIKDSLTISNILKCAQMLQENLTVEPEELNVNLQKVEDCDTSGVQLIISLQKSAIRSNKKISFDDVPDAVTAAFQSVGIDDMANYLTTEL